MPSFFGGVTGKASTSLFEVRLENDIIVLRGDETEASSQLLKGVVVLCLSGPLKIEDVHLKMTGQLRVGWTDHRLTSAGITNNRIDKTTEIFSHRWPSFITSGSNSKTSTLVPGNYEWPFELVIPGSMAESIEGMPDSHLIYKLKASVTRGKLAYDLHTYKPVRIIRTLAPSALELAHAMTVENVWPNKIEYQLIIPQKAIVFGTAINIQLRFTSLLKGLKIGPIKCVLVETQDLSIPGATAHTERHYRITRDVEEWNLEVNHDEHYRDMIDDNGQDGYVLEEMMPLPQRLQKCLQDVDVHGIKVRHKVKFNVALHNPDGHVSELRATLPVTIFISPNMPLNGEGCLLHPTPRGAPVSDIGAHAPPLYGEHILDQLYSDIDQSGLMTPTPQSGMNTPFYSQSRNGSNENLASLTSAIHSNGAVTAAALETRLQNLNLTSGNRNSSFIRTHPAHASGVNTPLSHPHTDAQASIETHSTPHSNPASNPLSRRTSEEDRHPMSALASGQHTPEHIDFFDLGDLTKVPSYATAVKAPARGISYSDAVPNYETATTTPSSPVREFAMPRSLSSEGQGVPANGNQVVNGNTNNNGNGHVSSVGLGTRRHSSRFAPHLSLIHSHSASIHSGDEDETRRLHFLRNRERAH